MQFILEVIPRSKKNSNQLITLKTGKTVIVPSKLYQKFEKECLTQIGEELKQNINHPINVKAHFYCQTRRRIDLVNLLNALDDMLTKAGVVADDNRNIIAGHDGSRVYWDKEHPRIEVWIEDLAEDYQDWTEKKDSNKKKINK